MRRHAPFARPHPHFVGSTVCDFAAVSFKECVCGKYDVVIRHTCDDVEGDVAHHRSTEEEEMKEGDAAPVVRRPHIEHPTRRPPRWLSIQTQLQQAVTVVACGCGGSDVVTRHDCRVPYEEYKTSLGLVYETLSHEEVDAIRADQVAQAREEREASRRGATRDVRPRIA